jgi:hypothetical protein
MRYGLYLPTRGGCATADALEAIVQRGRAGLGGRGGRGRRSWLLRQRGRARRQLPQRLSRRPVALGRRPIEYGVPQVAHR